MRWQIQENLGLPCIFCQSGKIILTCEALPGKISFTWSAAAQMNAKEEDTVVILIYNPARNYSVHNIGYSRADGTAEVTVPSLFTGEEVHCYLFFANMVSLLAEKSEEFISNSMYLGQVTVA